MSKVRHLVPVGASAMVPVIQNSLLHPTTKRWLPMQSFTNTTLPITEPTLTTSGKRLSKLATGDTNSQEK
jgi:hypothetical protein